MSSVHLSRAALLTLPVLLATSGAARAEGFYLKLFGGASALADSDVAIDGFATDIGVSFDTGAVAGGSVGYA